MGLDTKWSLLPAIGSAVLALAPGTSAEPAQPQCPASVVADRLDVLEPASRYSWALDSGVDRAMLAQVFSGDAVAEYVSADKESIFLNEQLRGLEAIYTWLHDNQLRPPGRPGHAVPHHFLSSPIAEVHGDVADLRFVLHGWPGNFVGAYAIKAVRTRDGWRISHLRLESMTESAMTSPEEAARD